MDGGTVGVEVPSSTADIAGLLDATRTLLGSAGGFLPDRVPVFDGLPEPFTAFGAARAEAAEHYHQPCDGVRGWLDARFGRSDPEVMAALGQADRATRDGLLGLLTVLVHLYRWDAVPPDASRFSDTELRLPAGIAEPWTTLCDEAGMPYVGTTWSLWMCNWHVPGREGDEYVAASLPELEPRLGCNWLRSPVDASLENFNLAFVCLEAKGAAVVDPAVDAVVAARRADDEGAVDALGRLAEAIDGAAGQFVDRIRSSRVALEGWLDLIQPTFAWGLPGADGQPLAGPGGMQLGTIHVLDTVLSVPGGSTIGKATSASRPYLRTNHRKFLSLLDRSAPSLAPFVRNSGRQDLKRAFNDAVRALRHFRVAHRVQGARYLRAGGDQGAPRMSSGTGISWREDPNYPDVEPAEHFERQMLDRLAETTDALVPGAGEPSEVRAPETAFRFLDRGQLRNLLRVADRRVLPAGSVIIAAGDRSEAMYLLVEGTALVVAPGGTSAPPVARLWPGELFGELSFLGAIPSKSVVAESDVVVDALHGEIVHALLGADPALAAGFYRSLAVLVAHRLNADATSAEYSVPVDA